ncbi:alpha/beta hydrolase [Oceanobacter sp. 4_MG-2023]|uniref:alpha/beta hydrolase n=2 Tax=Gammaproteobacteria TaxID=1236 RepID=UPI002732303C|nr:alpha/beta hydrolase [Oceanobacter sp. 4_MG-2023]MDP2546981.1 alpha/beta hydrolase [Oceanobacter sp. 4_MG-2023]
MKTTKELWNSYPLRNALPDWRIRWQPSAPEALTQAYRQYYRLPDVEAGQHRMGKLESAGFDIALQYWTCPDAVANLILVHGYYDHVGLYGSLIGFCRAQRLNLVAFDLPGHGLSSGEAARIDDFDQYETVFADVFQQAEQQLPALPWLAAGQSTGGAILASYLLKRHPVAGQSGPLLVWLLAPLLRPAGWRSGRWIHTLVHRFVARVPRRFVLNGNNRVFAEFVASSDPLQSRYLSVHWVTALKRWLGWIERRSPFDYPVRMIQGTADQTVDWRYNIPAYQRLFPALMLSRIVGAHHHLVNESPERLGNVYEVMRSDLSAVLAAQETASKTGQ